MIVSLLNSIIHRDEIWGSYHGTVVDNNDPLKLGRIKCTIVGIMEGKASELPWIFTRSKITALAMGGALQIPSEGEVVQVTFPTGDIYYGVYEGRGMTETARPNKFDTVYPDVWGIQDRKGNYIAATDTGSLILKHYTGSRIEFTADGDVLIKAARILYEKAGTDRIAEMGGNDRSKVGGQWEVKTESYIRIDTTLTEVGAIRVGGGNPEPPTVPGSLLETEFPT